MIMVPDSILQSELLTASEKLLFPQLVVICGPDGSTDLDNPELMKRLNISERSCSAFITNLNRAGFVTVLIDRTRKKNQRTIQLNELTQDFALSPVLLQKLMLADADSCVKLAQILASALPDAKSCVMLAQILASTNKDECADSQSFNEVDAKSCVNPDQISRFSDNRDNNIYNNILTNTQVSNINTTNSITKNRESSGLTQNPASTINVNGVSINAESLGKLLDLRGIEDDQVAPFVGEHAGRTYNDLKELRDLVRKWLRRQKPKAPKKTVEQRQADFKQRLNDYHKQNPGKYPVEHYASFFTYWTVLSKSGTTMRFEKDSFFDLPGKLAYSYNTIYLKNQTYANQSNNRAGNGKHLGLISEDDLSGNTAESDPRSADSGRSLDDQTETGGYETIHISLE